MSVATPQVSTPAPPPPVRRGRVGPIVVAVLAVGVALVSIATYAGGTLAELAEQGAGLAHAYVDAPAVVQGFLYLHIAAGSLALAIGPLQFVRRLRDRVPRVHRVVGRVYLVAVALGAVSAVALVPFNVAGMVGYFGFGALAALWGYSAWRAYGAARRRDFADHQAWMIRNYALTFAASTLRLWLGFLIGIQVPFVSGEPDTAALFANAYPAVPFLCWLPNLVLAEWLIRRRGLPSYRLAPR